MKLYQFLYLPWWYFKVRFLNKKIPLQTVIFVSNVCNYNCKHCCVDKSIPLKMSYEDVKKHLEYSYSLGSRFVDFEGGEPTLWRDGDRTVNDLCALAKSIGFFSTTVTTNASQDFSWLNSDHVFVSLDGIEALDKIRGKGAFRYLEENLSKYPQSKKLSVNMVINSINEDEVFRVLEYVEKSSYINGISFNFYNQVGDNVSLKSTLKPDIIAKLIEYKMKGYNIINTIQGLKNLKTPKVKRACWITNFITVLGERFIGCQMQGSDICKDCGLGMSGEMSALYNLNLETVLAGLKLRLFS